MATVMKINYNYLKEVVMKKIKICFLPATTSSIKMKRKYLKWEILGFKSLFYY